MVWRGSRPSVASATSTAPQQKENEPHKAQNAHKAQKRQLSNSWFVLCLLCFMCNLWPFMWLIMKFPFRSLYLKIFIWFWLAMIIINVVLFAAFALTRPTPTRRSWRDLAQTGPNSQKAAEIYEQSGSGALAAALQATEKNSGVRATFFDENGRELSGRNVPEKAQELSAKAAESRDIEFNFDVKHARRAAHREPEGPVVHLRRPHSAAAVSTNLPN